MSFAWRHNIKFKSMQQKSRNYTLMVESSEHNKDKQTTFKFTTELELADKKEFKVKVRNSKSHFLGSVGRDNSLALKERREIKIN